MQKWLEAGLIILGATLMTYSLIQNHDYRIKQLEISLENHKDKHDLQFKEVETRLSRIELAIGRIEIKLEEKR